MWSVVEKKFLEDVINGKIGREPKNNFFNVDIVFSLFLKDNCTK